MMKVNPRNVESATDVKPFGWADHAFIAEAKNLATRQGIYPTCLGTTYLSIGLPKGPLILGRIGIGDVVIEENTRILHFAIEQQPLLRLNAQFHTQAIQEIEIVCAGESNSHRAFETTTILPADAEPAGQRPIELGDGKQPIQGIAVSGRVMCAGRARISARSRIRVQVRNCLSIDALPNHTRNKQENQDDTSSHCNLFSTEWALALDPSWISLIRASNVEGRQETIEAAMHIVRMHAFHPPSAYILLHETALDSLNPHHRSPASPQGQ